MDEAAEAGLIRANLLDEWELTSSGSATRLRRDGDIFWLSCPAVGAIQFDLTSSSISAFLRKGITYSQFESVLIPEWLPLVYQARGIQVLHASAAVHLPTHCVIAFSGISGSGKSTLGYGLGQRPGWQQIADECLAIAVEGEQLRLVPIPNIVRLRKASLEYYSQGHDEQKRLEWLEGELRLGCVIFLELRNQSEVEAGNSDSLDPISGTEAYPLFLQQAFALTLKLHEQNRRLMQDYLSITRQIPTYRLRLSKSFFHLDEILDSVQSLVP